ncbi:DUF1588 domain-containing protein [Nannocystis sp. ILAH1]|uniref:DUF1588 domain-containing protein n=1 Tax=unclassified Nannocystis TaxID=2627009 RepID=UPI0022720206|nr:MULTISPECIES: DUF1588 domain-containing protein [unclassified Nannocystis]MCY0992633.1 DUF1588 domain-containing protein [Nannocystis sp. ILAH1]MCY1070137.1 DUF1588 domain-containing protein [Nannocystis sp. RBIL2]
MTRSHPKRTSELVTRAALIAVTGVGSGLGMSACSEVTDGECVPTDVFFREKVWAPTLAATCSSCHSSTGAAKHTKFVLTPKEVPGYLEANMKLVQDLARYEVDGLPLILAKPSMRVEHEGGLQLKPDSQEYNDLQALLKRFDNPVECEGAVNLGNYFDEVELLDEVDTLRKASLALAGRLPTPEEYESVRGFGIDQLDPVLDAVMKEDAFIDRVVEMYNDVFLTDRYIGGNGAVELLNAEKYPDAYWFEGQPDDVREQYRWWTNTSVAREALNLVAWIVKNDLSYKDIVEADYMVFTPFSAKAYGVDVKFNDPNDWKELAVGKLPGIPHAGVLTSAMWLNRFPTTPTNRNRHRARMTYKFFLATDVLRLGERPIDPTAIKTPNATRENPNCNVCHNVIDPVAGSFQNFNDMGDYQPLAETDAGVWYPEMLLPGFGEAQMPEGSTNKSEQWLAKQLTADDRFAQSAVNIVWRGLTGVEPINEPFDAAMPGFEEALKAFEVQDRVIKGIAKKFKENNYNLKIVFREIIKTDYFRAKNVRGEVDEVRARELAQLGTAQYLSPEQLSRKVEAVTGYPWRYGVNDSDLLLNENEYKIFYGGIDSDSIVNRITEPNGIMANIALRMSNEMSCRATSRDFAKDPSDRLLFPYVETSFVPQDDNGFAVPAVNDAIRANIQHLYDHVLGEHYDIGDPEVDAAYNLFFEIWQDGKAGLAAGTYTADPPCRTENDWWTGNPLPEENRITQDNDYTIRAWMGVLAYMLSDYRFLHE